MRLFILLSLLPLLPISVIGCSGTNGGRVPIVEPGTGNVHIKVWVVLSIGEEIGSSINKGCRLHEDEMRAIVNHLIANAGMFGNSTRFVWDRTITTIDDEAYSARTVSFSTFKQRAVDNHWSIGNVNIYFTGNIQPGSAHIQYGQNEDPSEYQRPWILVNDGISVEPPISSAQAIATDLILEHEMCHDLARFQSRTFSNGVTYNNAEHETFPGHPPFNDFPGHLMNEGIPHGRLIPGPANNSATEQGEVWNRISSGEWVNP